MYSYIAVVRKDEGTCYGVDFPDFPGCVTAGQTIEEATANAEEVLIFHAEGLVEDGTKMPKATNREDILADPDYADAVALMVCTFEIEL